MHRGYANPIYILETITTELKRAPKKKWQQVFVKQKRDPQGFGGAKLSSRELRAAALRQPSHFGLWSFEARRRSLWKLRRIHVCMF